jgi:outer membrane receptor protein involved in Fe transport
VRDPLTGFLFEIDATAGNFGKRLVNGLDVTAAYEVPTMSFGTFTISLGFHHFFTWKAEPVAGFGSNNFAGHYNHGTRPLAPGAIPRHKGFLRGEHEWKGFNFVATTHYISSFVDDPAFLNEPAWRADVRGSHRTVSDYITLDLQLSYQFVKPEFDPSAPDVKGGFTTNGTRPATSTFQRMLWGTSIRVGVVNAFDRQPPTVLSALNDNYDTSLHSLRNRYYYVGINKKF